MPGRSCRQTPAFSAEETALSQRLTAHVQALTCHGERFSSGSKAAARAYILEQLTDTLALPPVLHTFNFGDEQQGTNIVGELKADGPLFVVGAHYDTVPDSPGANDNASGVAVLLELARLLACRVHPWALRLVAFDNEEHVGAPPHQMGSCHYAQACRQRGEEIIGMWSLETLACYQHERGSQRYPQPFNLFYPETADFVAFVGNDASASLVRRSVKAFRAHKAFPAHGVAAPARFADVGRSDHWGFWQAGYQALMVTDTAEFRSAAYHSAADTPEKLDYLALARITRLLGALLSKGF